MPRVFVSYVHENQLIVDRLTNILTAHGVSVWLDHTSLQPGQRWVDEIRRGIREGDFFLACFSPEYASRPQTYMNEELTLAIDQLRQRPTDRSWFIPVFLSASSSIPDRNIGGGETLSSIQHVSLADDWDEGIRRLLEVIGPKDAALRHAALAGLADVSNRKRIAAADALGAMGASALFAVPKLATLLKDKNETVVAAVAEALGNICGGSAGRKSPEFDAVVRTLLQTIKTADVYYFSEHAVRASSARSNYHLSRVCFAS